MCMNPYLDLLLMLPFIGLVGWNIATTWTKKERIDGLKKMLVVAFAILFTIGLFSLISH